MFYRLKRFCRSISSRRRTYFLMGLTPLAYGAIARVAQAFEPFLWESVSVDGASSGGVQASGDTLATEVHRYSSIILAYPNDFFQLVGTMLTFWGIIIAVGLVIAGIYQMVTTCPQCKEASLTRTDKVVRKPTRRSPGRREFTAACHNCGYHHTHVHVLPRLSSSSSRSSSSGCGGGAGCCSGCGSGC